MTLPDLGCGSAGVFGSVVPASGPSVGNNTLTIHGTGLSDGLPGDVTRVEVCGVPGELLSSTADTVVMRVMVPVPPTTSTLCKISVRSTAVGFTNSSATAYRINGRTYFWRGWM